MHSRTSTVPPCRAWFLPPRLHISKPEIPKPSSAAPPILATRHDESRGPWTSLWVFPWTRCGGAPPQEGLAAAALDTRVPGAALAHRRRGGGHAAADRRVHAQPRRAHGDPPLLRPLPPPPVVSNHAALSALLPSPQGSSDDRISNLPDKLLRDIVSRLPIKDGARTAVLSCRWRGIWRSVPLVLVDSEILSVETSSGLQVAQEDAHRVASAVTHIPNAHPGPFRYVRLICSFLAKCPNLLAYWLQFLAVKGVQELILVNRPWPLNMPIPPTFFAMATLTRLYLGVFQFPDMRTLPRVVSFPHLRELGLCCVQILRWEDMDFVLARRQKTHI